MDFTNFRDWALKNGYKDNLTIDRIDNNDSYYPHNCRFVSHRENSNNREITKRISYRGQTKTITEWAEETGIPYSVIRWRFISGWPTEKILAKKRIDFHVRPGRWPS